jgi:hypothetical protein
MELAQDCVHYLALMLAVLILWVLLPECYFSLVLKALTVPNCLSYWDV